MLAKGIADFLDSQGIGTYGTDLFIRIMPDNPDTPDDAICIYDESAPVETEHFRYDLDQFGFMIMVRGSYSFCKSKLQAIHKIVPQLDGTYDSIPIYETFTQTPPAFVENDDKGRAVYTAHYISECSIGATSRTAT